MFFRELTPDDRAVLAEWISADPDHRAKATPDFWLSPGPDSVSYALEDDKGPVLYVRQDAEGRDVRIHIQFPPDERLRIARALINGIRPVKEWAKERGFRALIFDSVSPSLIKFTQRLGFEPEYRCYL